MNGSARRGVVGALAGLLILTAPAAAALPTCRIGGGPKAPTTGGVSSLVLSGTSDLGMVGGVPTRTRMAGGGAFVLQRRTATAWEAYATLPRPAGADGALVSIGGGVFAQWVSLRGEQKGVGFVLATGEGGATPPPPLPLGPVEVFPLPGGGVGMAASSLFGSGVQWSEWSPAAGRWTRPVTVFPASDDASAAADVVAVPGLGVVAGQVEGRPRLRVRGADGVWGPATSPGGAAVSARGDFGHFTLAAGAGDVLAAWSGDDVTRVAHLDAAGTWSPVRRVGPGASGALALATSPSGRAVLAWPRQDPRSTAVEGPLVVSTAERPGGPWAPARALCRGGFRGGVGIVSAIADDGASVVLTTSVGEPPPYRGGGVLLATRPVGRASFSARPLTRAVPALLPGVALPEAGPAIVAWVSGPTIRRMSGRMRAIGVGRPVSPPTGPPPP